MHLPLHRLIRLGDTTLNLVTVAGFWALKMTRLSASGSAGLLCDVWWLGGSSNRDVMSIDNKTALSNG